MRNPLSFQECHQNGSWKRHSWNFPEAGISLSGTGKRSPVWLLHQHHSLKELVGPQQRASGLTEPPVSVESRRTHLCPAQETHTLGAQIQLWELCGKIWSDFCGFDPSLSFHIFSVSMANTPSSCTCHVRGLYLKFEANWKWSIYHELYHMNCPGNISDLYLLQWETGRFAKGLFVALETKSLTYGISMTACNMSVTSGSLGCTSLQLCVVGNYNIICEPIKLCTW